MVEIYAIITASLLGLVGIALFLYFVFRKHDPAKPIEEYKEIRDKVTVREEESEEESEKEAGEEPSGGWGIGNLIEGFIVIMVGVNLMPTVADSVSAVQGTNATSAASRALLNTIPMFFGLGIMVVAVVIVFNAIKGRGMI